MKSEKRIQDEIRIALSKHGIVFRTNAGEFWQGRLVYSKEFNQRVLINLRRVDGLPTGFSDLIYFGRDGTMAFIETKTAKGKLTDEQSNFLDRMKSHGFRADIARSVEDALKIIGKEKKNER